MLGTRAGGPIPLHPTMRKEKEKPHNHPLFPHHSCSDSCNSASINPCPSPAGLNWGEGSAQAAVELGCNRGGNPPSSTPPGMQRLNPAPWAHPLCSAKVLHHQVLCRWAHLQFWCGPTPVVATSIK